MRGERMRRQPLPLDLAPISRPKRPNEPADKVRRCVRRHLKASEGRDIKCVDVANELKMAASEVVRLWEERYWGVITPHESGDDALAMLGEDGV